MFLIIIGAHSNPGIPPTTPGTFLGSSPGIAFAVEEQIFQFLF